MAEYSYEWELLKDYGSYRKGEKLWMPLKKGRNYAKLGLLKYVGKYEVKWTSKGTSLVRVRGK